MVSERAWFSAEDTFVGPSAATRRRVHGESAFEQATTASRRSGPRYSLHSQDPENHLSRTSDLLLLLDLARSNRPEIALRID